MTTDVCIVVRGAASIRCDIVRNHSYWCKCLTPVLHTYIVTNHKCDDYCDISHINVDKMCLTKKSISNIKSRQEISESSNKSTKSTIADNATINTSIMKWIKSTNKDFLFIRSSYTPFQSDIHLLSKQSDETFKALENLFESKSVGGYTFSKFAETVIWKMSMIKVLAESTPFGIECKNYAKESPDHYSNSEMQNNSNKKSNQNQISRSLLSSNKKTLGTKNKVERRFESSMNSYHSIPDEDTNNEGISNNSITDPYKNIKIEDSNFIEQTQTTPFITEHTIEGKNHPELNFNNIKNNQNDLQNNKCDLCLLENDSFETLVIHLKKHQTDKLFICCYCQKIFGDNISLNRHIRTHTGERPYLCNECGKRFSIPGNFKKHRDTHLNIRTQACSVCDKTFSRKEHLKYHMRIHTGEKPFKCSKCDAAYTSRYCLNIHMNIHLGVKPYKCNYCDKCFYDKSTMRKHIRIHTGEKPYQCKICSRCFKDSSALNNHAYIHQVARPFKCFACPSTFKTKNGAYQHEKIHKEEKRFVCKYCGAYFRNKYNMDGHERIHTGEKPYTCSYCNATFRTRSCLCKHIVIHAGESGKLFKCEFCDKKFYRKVHLKSHTEAHLGIKHYECHVCYKRMRTNPTLKKHLIRFHPNKFEEDCKNNSKLPHQ